MQWKLSIFKQHSRNELKINNLVILFPTESLSHCSIVYTEFYRK